MPVLTDTPITHKSSSSPLSTPEDDNRGSLFTLGVIILELIFRQKIEACGFRYN